MFLIENANKHRTAKLLVILLLIMGLVGASYRVHSVLGEPREEAMSFFVISVVGIFVISGTFWLLFWLYKALFVNLRAWPEIMRSSRYLDSGYWRKYGLFMQHMLNMKVTSVNFLSVLTFAAIFTTVISFMVAFAFI